MSIYKLVKQSLENNPGIVIMQGHETNHLPYTYAYGGSYMGVISRYDVAPKVKLYTESELQKFMINSIPEGAVLSFKEDVHTDFKEKIVSGTLFYDERIGEKTTTTLCKLTDVDLFNENGFINGERILTESEDYMRRTVVAFFLSTQMVKDYWGKGFTKYVPPGKKDNLLSRLFH